MRACMFVFGVVCALPLPRRCAHGPQIQITNDNNKDRHPARFHKTVRTARALRAEIGVRDADAEN